MSFFTLVTLLLFAVCKVSAQTDASYCVGIDVDGVAEEWESCSSPEREMDMVQVGIPDSNLITDGIRFRFAHDGTNVYLLAIVKGEYHLNLTAGNGFSHSVAVMWKVGEDATMFNMGGCPLPLPPNANNPYDCPRYKEYCALETTNCNCDAHIVDVWHIETGSPGSIPGVQYPYRGPVVQPSSDGTYSSLGYDPENLGMYQPSVERLFNGNDHTSSSDDEFSVHPCLRDDDGSSAPHLRRYRNTDTENYRNQIRFAWSHTAINSYSYPFGEIGADGFYIYEFSRPLITRESTDVQLQVGTSASFAFAFWVPPSMGEEWGDANHYVAPPNFQFRTVNFVAQPVGDNSPGEVASKISGLMMIFISSVAVLASN